MNSNVGRVLSIDLALGFVGVEIVYLNSDFPVLDLTLIEGMTCKRLETEESCMWSKDVQVECRKCNARGRGYKQPSCV